MCMILLNIIHLLLNKSFDLALCSALKSLSRIYPSHHSFTPPAITRPPHHPTQSYYYRPPRLTNQISLPPRIDQHLRSWSTTEPRFGRQLRPARHLLGSENYYAQLLHCSNLDCFL